MLSRLFLLFLTAIIFATPCGAEPLLKVGYVKSPGYFTQNENGDYYLVLYEGQAQAYIIENMQQIVDFAASERMKTEE